MFRIRAKDQGRARARRRVTSLLGVLALSFTGLVTFTAAHAGTVSPYTIDGTVPDTVAGITSFTDPSGNTAELGPVNSSATKLGVINTASTPMLAMTNPNAQVDLSTIWLGTTKDADKDTWLYLGWERDSSKGSGVIMYEFMQSAAPTACAYATKTDAQLIESCNPWANRQAGDFILVWDQVGSKVSIILRTWQDDGSGGLTLDAGVDLTTLNYAYAKVSSDGYRGEGAVNLSDSIFKNVTGRCVSYGNVIPGTVTGNSDTADYKDTVLKDISSYVRVSNCGTVRVQKATVPTGGTGNFNYSLSRSSGDIHYAADGYSGTQLTTETGTLTSHGDYDDITKLIAGTNYTLSETMGASTPYDLTSIVCTPAGGSALTVYPGSATFSVVEGVTTTCVITNTLQKGTLRVTKVVNNNYGGLKAAKDFAFKVGTGGAISFEADGTNDLSVDAGSYTVVENGLPITGYSTSYENSLNTNKNCNNLAVPAGGLVTCTITNSDIQPKLTVIKHVTNDNGGTLAVSDFPLYVGTTQVTSGAKNGFNAGSYTVSETSNSNYTASAWSGDCASDGSITLNIGDDKTCEITNNDNKAEPGGSTTQSWVLKDRLSITGIRTGAPDASSATVTFRLYDTASCAADDQVGTDQTASIVSGVASTATGVAVTAPGTYYWKAFYSGDQYNAEFATACGDEITVIATTIATP